MLLVSQVLRAHGGLDRWDRISAFSAHVSLGGTLFPLDGAAREYVVEGETGQPRLNLFCSSDATRHGVYRPDRVELRDSSNALLDALDRPIASLAGRPADRMFTELESVFLIGNLLWSAIMGPFVLAAPRVSALESVSKGIRHLDVTLPPDLDPLCPHRRLRIREDGTLYRSDQDMPPLHPFPVAETLSAHLVFDGILVATLRRVRALGLDGDMARKSLLDLEIFDVRFS